MVASQVNTNDVLLDIDGGHNFDVILRTSTDDVVTLHYDSTSGKFTVHKIGEPEGRVGTTDLSEQINLRLLIDRSSLEIFINDGELVFTERFYVEECPDLLMRITPDANVSGVVYELENHAVNY
jgi:beta-fructofuranosidase